MPNFFEMYGHRCPVGSADGSATPICGAVYDASTDTYYLHPGSEILVNVTVKYQWFTAPEGDILIGFKKSTDYDYSDIYNKGPMRVDGELHETEQFEYNSGVLMPNAPFTLYVDSTLGRFVEGEMPARRLAFNIAPTEIPSTSGSNIWLLILAGIVVAGVVYMIKKGGNK